MVPSYDALASKFPTGDHHGATIDYLFLRQDAAAPVLGFTDHYATELNSDHDAVTADLTWTTAVPGDAYRVAPGTVVSDPGGTRAAQRAVLRLTVGAVNHAPAGATIHLTTTRITTPSLKRALDQAIARHVNVQLIMREAHRSRTLTHFQDALGHRATAKSFAIGCRRACERVESRRSLPPMDLLVSAVSTTPAVRIVADHAPTVSALRHVTTARVSISKDDYDRGFRLFFRLAGHPVGG
jgi:hypothetical protein